MSFAMAEGEIERRATRKKSSHQHKVHYYITIPLTMASGMTAEDEKGSKVWVGCQIAKYRAKLTSTSRQPPRRLPHRGFVVRRR
jgi:hypothetical protein